MMFSIITADCLTRCERLLVGKTSLIKMFLNKMEIKIDLFALCIVSNL